MWGSAVRVCPGLHLSAGGLAQLARAPALQAGGRGFEPHILHQGGPRRCPARFFDRIGRKADTKRKRNDRKARLGGARASPNSREREASEGVRRMPWLPEAKKDAAGRERPRGGASSPRSAGVEANPTNRNIPVVGGKENNSDPPSSGERKGDSPNRGRRGARGVVGPAQRKKRA